MQKTAYEMRISDWSSDVCSSDLHEDIGKQDRAVETETPDRLQRHFGRRLGIVAELEEPALGLPQRAIFGQIASGLAHQPQCGPRLLHPAQRCQQALRWRLHAAPLSSTTISLESLVAVLGQGKEGI